jgi:hypothetical protein
MFGIDKGEWICMRFIFAVSLLIAAFLPGSAALAAAGPQEAHGGQSQSGPSGSASTHGVSKKAR